MKVCPRCSYVDSEGRRVCVACRRSLMGSPEQDLERVLAQREALLAGEEQSQGRAPWGPALTALVAQAVAVGRDQVTAAQPESVPAMTRVAFDALLAVPDRIEVMAGSRATSPSRDAPEARPMALDCDETPNDAVAEATRQQLARMYDTRLAAPGPIDADRPEGAPRRDTSASRPDRGPRKGRGKVLLALALAVGVVVGVRYIRATLADGDRAAAQNPTTPVDKLPWQLVQYGQVTVQMPTVASTATRDTTSGGAYRYERFVLPDLTLTVISRDAVASMSTDVSLRSYAGQVAVQLGGRLTTGFARDVTFGTTFSASVDLPEGQSYLYVLSTPTEVVEVRAEIGDPSSGRALKIYERVIRSFSPV